MNNLVKGADGHVDKIIDQAAGVAKDKIGQMIGTKDQKGAGGEKPKSDGGKSPGDGEHKGIAGQAAAFGKGLMK